MLFFIHVFIVLLTHTYYFFFRPSNNEQELHVHGLTPILKEEKSKQQKITSQTLKSVSNINKYLPVLKVPVVKLENINYDDRFWKNNLENMNHLNGCNF